MRGMCKVLHIMSNPPSSYKGDLKASPALCFRQQQRPKSPAGSGFQAIADTYLLITSLAIVANCILDVPS